MTGTIAATVRIIANLDLAPVIARIDALKGERVTIEAAIESGDARMSELASRIREVRERGLDSDAAGDALLSGGDVLTASPSIETLQCERDALRVGIGNLRERESVLRGEIVDIQQDITTLVDEAISPLAASIRLDAEKAVAALAVCYAAASAIAEVVPVPCLQTLTTTITGPLAYAVRSELLGRSRLPIPPQIEELTSGLASAGLALGRRASTTIPLPEARGTHG